MTRDDALLLADKILALVNSRPHTPSREEIALCVLQSPNEEPAARSHILSETVGMRLARRKNGEPSRRLSETAPMPTTRWQGNGGEEWGHGIEYMADQEAEVLAELHADACLHLPPDTRYEVRKRHRSSDWWPNGMAWYRNTRPGSPDNTDAKPENIEPGEKAGYILVGQFRTPDPDIRLLDGKPMTPVGNMRLRPGRDAEVTHEVITKEKGDLIIERVASGELKASPEDQKKAQDYLFKAAKLVS